MSGISTPAAPPRINLFLAPRFYVSGGLVVSAFITAWLLDASLEIPQILLMIFILLTIGDLIALFANGRGVQAVRLLPDRMSNGDENPVVLKIKSYYPFPIKLSIIEELPEQLQARNNQFARLQLAGYASTNCQYILRPTVRGSYDFGYCLLFINTQLNLITRRIHAAAPKTVQVYPSYIQLRKYALLAQSAQQAEVGAKKLRKIGHSLEFEQIKEYVPGDDIRSLNWKATARKGALMANHFIDERSQQVFVLIDKGRLMKMPFNQLTLLDYAINATLVLCNVSLYKQDKFGLITFSHNAGTVLPAQRSKAQMSLVLDALYKQETDFLESDFEKLYLQVRTYIKHRSLLMLFTQFESMGGMKRQLPYLKQLAKHHLLLVVFFENTELTELAAQPVEDLEGIYTKTIAEKFAYEKKMIVKELLQHGILALLTAPEKLTIQVVNKYLELKTKQAI